MTAKELLPMGWKELLKSTGDGLANVTSLGGHYRTKKALNEYKDAYARYKREVSTSKDLSNSIKLKIEQIGSHVKHSLYLLDKAENLLEATVPHVRSESQSEKCQFTSRKIRDLNTDLSALTDTVKGTAVSSAFTMGSWFLVQSFGAASTGTAMSTLSGAALSNATGAWFGGGSLATGGAGMAGGGMVIAGMLALPVIAYASFKSHKKANEIQEETAKIWPAISETLKHQKELSSRLEKASSAQQKLSAALNRFKRVIKRAEKKLRPFGSLSRFWQWVKRLFGREALTTEQLKMLKVLQLETKLLLTVLGKVD